MSDLKALLDTASGLSLSDAQVDAFVRYRAELLAWNAHTNLTGITDPDQIDRKHFADSLSIVQATGPLKDKIRLIDIGTGAGFPGLPLKILFPNIDLTLADSVGKKTAFLTHIVNVLELDSVTIITDRAEALGLNKVHREKYDLVTARAVAETRVLAEYLLPLCKVGGTCLAMKGPKGQEEAQHAHHAISTLGGKLREVFPVSLIDVEEIRVLIVIEKVMPTPSGYPRRVGIAGQRPLKGG